jgi:dolichyl-phosphate-mannose--protein O-mannosyl transferase
MADRARWGLAAVAGVAALAVFAPGITRFAEPIWDEGHYLTDAYRMFRGGGLLNPEHPPLGKVLMGLGMLAVGDDALGWRVVSLAASVLLVAVLPLTLEAAGVVRPDAPRWVLLVPSALLLADPLVSTHARIALLDAPEALFYTGAALAWMMALHRDGATASRARVVAGALAGLALATKWTAWTLLPPFVVSCVVRDGAQFRVDWRRALEVASPAALSYVASFAVPGAMAFDAHAFPAVDGPLDPSQPFPLRLVVLHWRMLSFHTYYYASEWQSCWCEWLVARQAVWLTAQAEGDALRIVAALGSPAWWPLGFLAMGTCAIVAVRRGALVPAALAAFPVLQLLLWALALRMSFLYYALTMLPFLAMALAYGISEQCARSPANARPALAATVGVLCVAAAWSVYVDPLARGTPISERELRAYCEGAAGAFVRHDAFPADRVIDLARAGAFGAARILR